MSKAKRRRRYTDYEYSDLARKVVEVRQRLGLSQGKLAASLGIHNGNKRTLRRIEAGGGINPELRRRLVDGLVRVAEAREVGIDRDELERAAGLRASPAAESLTTRRDVLARLAVVPLGSARAPRRRNSAAERGHDLLDAVELPASYVHLVRNLARDDVELVREAASRETWWLEGPARRNNEEAIRAMARWKVLEAASYQEDDDGEGLEAGIQAAITARERAERIGDAFLGELAAWYEVVLWRKWGHGRSGDRWRYDEAARQVERLLDAASFPVIKALACAEHAKLALLAGSSEAFDDRIRDGLILARAVVTETGRRPNTAEPWSWIPSFAEHAHAVLWDAHLRGYERFGPDDRRAVVATTAEATRYPEGLSLNIKRITLPLGKAAALWRLGDDVSLRDTVPLWWSAMECAVETGQRQQIVRGKRMLAERLRLRNGLPQEIVEDCDRCLGATRSILDRSKAGYFCSERRNGRLCGHKTVDFRVGS